MGLQHPAISRTLRTGYPFPDSEPAVVDYCCGCGEEIYEGDEVFDYNGDLLHQDSGCCEEYISNASISTVAE